MSNPYGQASHANQQPPPHNGASTDARTAQPFATGVSYPPASNSYEDPRSNKRVLADLSSPGAHQYNAAAAPEENHYEANRRLFAANAQNGNAQREEHFGTNALFYGATESTLPSSSTLNRPNAMDQPRKKLRVGGQLDDDSNPPSSVHSLIASPVDSDSSPRIPSPANYGSQADESKPSFLDIRNNLSHIAINSQPGSSASSSRGSVPPPDNNWNGDQGEYQDPNLKREEYEVDRKPNRLTRGVRPPGQQQQQQQVEYKPPVQQQLPPSTPQSSIPQVDPSRLTEPLFDIFVKTIMSQPQQMGFAVPVIRTVWLGAGGDNQAAFTELASRFQDHVMRQRQQAEQQRLASYHQQQQLAYQQQQQQQAYLQQAQWSRNNPGQPMPQFAPGTYAPPQYQGQQQQQFQSPYANRNITAQQYQQQQISRGVAAARPRPSQPYANHYVPPRSGAQPTVHNAVLPRYSQPLPPSGPLRKRKPAASDSDGEENYSDHDDDAYSGPPAHVVAAANQRAMSFFNECTKDELTELAACTPTQATIVIKMRPFHSIDDFHSRTRKQKGVGNNMWETYLSVIEGMSEVDKVLNECETIGRDLSAIMQIWAGKAPGQATVVPILAADVGVNLTAIPDENMVNAAELSHDPAVREAFRGYMRQQPAGVPSTIVLKDYQMVGLNWLALLYRRKTSCILADEMGLGKTAQVIALLSHLKSIGEKGPHLIIVPSSTLENWMREFSIFAPDLRAESYYGSQADRSIQRSELAAHNNSGALDVVVTTYNIATSSADDQKFLRKKMNFQICVFDEGHQLKNSESKKYKDLMGIKAKWRLLLTGTPLQNNLQELVSLLSFILPDQFRDANDSLKALFKVGPSSAANLLSRERVTRAKKMMTPFVLRRKKAQVLKDLPKKFEKIEWCEMTPLQREVHSEAMTRSKKALMETAEKDIGDLDEDDEPVIVKKPTARTGSKTGNKSNANSGSNVLMDLRKASNHPMLFRRLYDNKMLKVLAKECLKEEEFMDRDRNLIYEDMEVMTDFELHRFCGNYKYLKQYCLKNEEWMQAGKIIALKRMLPEMKARGDRVLLFSQFTQVLEILEVVLGTMGIKYLKLTGQTNVTDRQSMVDEYTNNPEITVFLLSTRAGGLGLNLTAANTVIMHDQDFNPHADKQAEDRSYRIGQLRDVTVYKLICKDSVEEMMRALATQKLLLDSEVSGGTDAVQDESADAQSEKKMRTSLLSNLKKRFEGEGEIGLGGAAYPTGGGAGYSQMS